MKPETKTHSTSSVQAHSTSLVQICQNHRLGGASCQKEFTIEPDDFSFYEKIKVPPPTFCPSCRAMRRFMWRNERNLYHNTCAFSGKKIISMFSPETKLVVYDRDIWWSDKWDPTAYGQEYDFSKPFFEQFLNLYKRIPQLSLFNTHITDSDYTNYGSYNKQCYLFTAGGLNEKVSYSNRCNESKNCLDMYIGEKNEKCYECVYCNNSYQLFFSRYSNNCIDSSFLFDCKNCNDCFGCYNLRNKSYCIFNEQYSKDEYKNKINELFTGSFSQLQNLIEKYEKEVASIVLHKFAATINSHDVSGNNIKNSKNCHYCFDVGGDKNENCKFVNWGGFQQKDSYDTGPGAGWGAEFIYETLDTFKVFDLKFCNTVHESHSCTYSINCHSCKNLFGCVGLRNKQYCILNKQYTKEEYFELLPKIIEHMKTMPYVDSMGISYGYGEFFPSELSPFAYNESIAQEYFPLSEEQIKKYVFKVKEKITRNHILDLKSEDLPDNIKDVDTSIIGKVIQCAHKGECRDQCTEAFKIREEDFSFYKKMNIALPRLCPNCRHFDRLKKRNPLELWHRVCMCDKTNHDHGSGKCDFEFETSYSPDRPEIVYCEKCYQQEVY